MSFVIQKNEEKHEHKWVNKTKTILVNAGRNTAKDKLYYRVCETESCEAKQTYDVERLVK